VQCSFPPPLQQSDRNAGRHDRGSKQQPQTVGSTPCESAAGDGSLVSRAAKLWLAPNPILPEHRSFSRSLRPVLQLRLFGTVDGGVSAAAAALLSPYRRFDQRDASKQTAGL